LSAEDVAARIARERQGLTLVDFVEVGLPCWQVLARCDVLARKPISAIDEAIMKAISLGIDRPSDLQLLLGLDQTVFEAAVVGMLSEGWVTGSSEQPLSLSEDGVEALTSAIEIVSEERVVPFYYDGLLRRPVAIDDAIDPERARAQGIREIPPVPGRPPDVSELRSSRGELVRILRALRDGRDQESELLAIRGFDRRDRRYRPALAMLLVPERGAGPSQLAIAIDGEASVEHEAAFSTGGRLERLGVERPLRSRRRGPLVIRVPKELRDRLDAETEDAARERIARAEGAFDGARPDRAAETELREARRDLGGLSPRTVVPPEHQLLLEAAIDSAGERLLIRGGGLTGRHLDGPLLKKLRSALERGARVRIAVRPSSRGGHRAFESLTALAHDEGSLELGPEPPADAESILLSDDRFAVIGRYSWLGQLGDADRLLGDRRSVLTTDREWIDALWERFDGRDPYSNRTPKRKGRRGGRRRDSDADH
jgi:hypothetical protein